jgi:hypothetical protein
MTTSQTKCPVIEFDHHGPEASNERDRVLERVRDHPLFFTVSNGS